MAARSAAPLDLSVHTSDWRVLLSKGTLSDARMVADLAVLTVYQRVSKSVGKWVGCSAVDLVGTSVAASAVEMDVY
jgi:hypothetical protein